MAVTESISDDIVESAEEIAKFLFGSTSTENGKDQRKVYYLSGLPGSRRLPTFRLGTIICARKSKLLGWIAAQEEATDAPDAA